MASQWNMRNISWLLIFLMVLEFRSGFCDLTLKMNAKLEGVRKRSVVIPCTYTPSNQYKEIRIEWFYESQSVIHRTESQDTIPLVKFRDRVEISKSPPGDVSLTVKRLEPADHGNFKCKVIWKDSNGKQITKEDTTMLRIIRPRPVTQLPLFTAEEPKTTIKTDAPDEEGSTSGEPKFRTETYMEIRTTAELKVTKIKTATPNEEGATSGEPKLRTVKTATPNEEGATSGEPKLRTGKSHDNISAVVTRTQNTNFYERSTTTYLFTTALIYSDPKVAASKGSRMFLNIIIVGLACVVCILILTVVLAIIRKKKAYHYNLPTMNQLASALESGSNGCGACSSSVDPAPRRVSNKYELYIPVPEYHSLQASSNEYEVFLIQNPEEENRCNC